MVDNLKYTEKQYNLDANVERYGTAIEKVGLWNSEKIIFDKYISKNNKILDLGCGAGRTTINLFKNGFLNIKGIDIASNLIDYAKDYSMKNNLDINFEVGDATSLNEDDNSYDVVIFSYNGMQCIPGYNNRLSVLKEVYRVLKKDGVFIFTAHDRHDPKASSHKSFWDKIEKDWENGITNNLECLGDLITKDQSGEESFIHFSTLDEMIDFVHNEKFEILEYEYSYNISDESGLTKEFAGDTVFWVLKKF